MSPDEEELVRPRRFPVAVILLSAIAVALILLWGTLPMIRARWPRPLPGKLKLEIDSSLLLSGADTFHEAHGRYPNSINELLSALRREQGKDASVESLRDPWGGEYEFDVVDRCPRVRSLGSDGKPGGAGDAGDRAVIRGPVLFESPR